MKMKKLVSGIAALAMAVSAFSAMSITASAVVSTTPAIDGSYSDGVFTFTVDGVEDRGSLTSQNSSVTGTVTDADDSTNSVTVNFIAAKGRNNASGRYDGLIDGAITLAKRTTESSEQASVSSRCVTVTPTKAGTFGFTFTAYKDYGSSAYAGTLVIAEVEGDSPWIVDTTDVKSSFTAAKGVSSYSEDVTYDMKAGHTYVVLTSGSSEKNFTYAFSNMTYKVSTETKETVGYTVQFVNEDGTTIKDPVTTRTDYVGETVKAAAADLTDITYNSQRYIYESGNNGIKLSSKAADNVITLVFRKAKTFTVNITADYGEVESAKIADGVTVTEHDSYTSDAYPKYKVIGTVVYATTANYFNNADWFHYTNSSVSADVDVTIPYTALTGEYIYYAEGEDVFSNNGVSNAGVRCSMGAGGDVDEKTIVKTLAPGKYKIYSAVWGGGTTESYNSTYTMSVGDNSVYTISTTGSLVATESDEFTVSEESALSIEKTTTGSRGTCVDYVVVVKTGDVETDTKEAAYAFDTTTSEIADQSIYVTATQNGTALTTIPYAVSNVLDAEALSGNLKFGLIITDIPTDVTIESVVIK